MNLIIVLMLFLISLPSFAQDINKDVETIVNSVTKSTEKPLIMQDSCCPACPKEVDSKKGLECEGNLPLRTFEGKGRLDKDILILLSGKKYEVRMNPKSKSKCIMNKETMIKYFTLSDEDKNFYGEVSIQPENPKDRFLREYEKLEDIYNDIKFRELCEYLSSNQQKYAKLKGKKINLNPK